MIVGFRRDDLRRPLSIYRAMQPSFGEAGAFIGAPIRQPASFVFGMVTMLALKQRASPSAPNQKGYLPIEGAGYRPQLKASEIVTEVLVGF